MLKRSVMLCTKQVELVEPSLAQDRAFVDLYGLKSLCCQNVDKLRIFFPTIMANCPLSKTSKQQNHSLVRIVTLTIQMLWKAIVFHTRHSENTADLIHS